MTEISLEQVGGARPAAPASAALRITVLDLDGSLPGQTPVMRRRENGQVDVVDLRDMGRALRLWAWDRDYRRFAARLPMPVGAPSRVFLTGSGDYHHLTTALLERIQTTVTLVHFDNHPDWAWTFPRRHCGSWINEALELPTVARVVTVGCCSDDLSRLDRRGENLRALRSGRLVMMPWRARAARLASAAETVPGHLLRDDQLYWSTLQGLPPATILSRLAAAIMTDAIWISFDKDVLPESEAATNWDQGGMPLATVEMLLAGLAETFRVEGVDICGDYSPALHLHPMKWTEALLDQPRRPPLSPLVNETTNESILSLLERVL